jgi:hypothetical protein
LGKRKNKTAKQALNLKIPCASSSPMKTRGVSRCGLAIYILKYLRAKEESWKLKYFIMQKHNLQKTILQRKPKILQEIITLELISSFNTSQNIIFQKSSCKNRPIA